MTKEAITRWSKSHPLKFVFAIITTIAAIVTIAVGLISIFTGPRTKLSATYKLSEFAIPSIFLQKTALDTALARRDTLLNRLFSPYNSSLIAKLQFSVPDSMRPAYIHSYLGATYRSQIQEFNSINHSLTILEVKNEGDKSINGVSILFPYPNHFEYKDGSGHLQKGSSNGKFIIGDLTPTESRKIFIWSQTIMIFPSANIFLDLNVAYSDGIVRAETPTETTGVLGWAIQHYLVTMDIFLILGLIGWGRYCFRPRLA